MNADFEQGLRERLASSSALTSQIGGYILESGGKRMRPRLVLSMGTALGVAEEVVLPLAYAVEILHTASLLHDDVVDGTEIRRARPTANQVFGDKSALLAGDFLSASALDTVFALGNVRLASEIVRTIKKMSEGELREIEHATAFHDRPDVYLDIIYLKTASLFELCTSAPGIIAGIDPERLDAVAAFGRGIGMAFQIVDDIINLVPVENDNKDAYNDILERKSTLPLILLFQEKPQLLGELARTREPEDWRRMIVPHLNAEILTRSRAVASQHLERAAADLRAKGMLTADLRHLSDQILAPVANRF